MYNKTRLQRGGDDYIRVGVSVEGATVRGVFGQVKPRVVGGDVKITSPFTQRQSDVRTDHGLYRAYYAARALTRCPPAILLLVTRV